MMPRNIIVFVFLVFAGMLLSGYVNTLLNNVFDLHLFFVCLSEIYLENLSIHEQVIFQELEGYFNIFFNKFAILFHFYIITLLAIICLHLQGSLPGLYLQPVQVSLVYPV